MQDDITHAYHNSSTQCSSTWAPQWHVHVTFKTLKTCFNPSQVKSDRLFFSSQRGDFQGRQIETLHPTVSRMEMWANVSKKDERYESGGEYREGPLLDKLVLLTASLTTCPLALSCYKSALTSNTVIK